MGRELEIGREILQGHGCMEGSAPRFNPVESHGKGQRCSNKESPVRRAGTRCTIPCSWSCQGSRSSTGPWCGMSIFFHLYVVVLFICVQKVARAKNEVFEFTTEVITWLSTVEASFGNEQGRKSYRLRVITSSMYGM
jgi:hypothetical protein